MTTAAAPTPSATRPTRPGAGFDARDRRCIDDLGMAVDLDTLESLPQLRSDLRRGRRIDPTTLRRQLRTLRTLDAVRAQPVVEALPATAAAIRAVILAESLGGDLRLPKLDRTHLAAACLLVDLDPVPGRAAAMAARVPSWPTAIARLIRQSGERIDGTGHPDGLTARSLSTVSQAVAIVAECSGRLAGTDRIDAGVAVTSFAAEASRGRWDAEIAACIERAAKPLVATLPTASATAAIVRIDAAHDIAEVRAATTEATEATEAVEMLRSEVAMTGGSPERRDTDGRASLRGLRASQSPVAVRRGR